MKNKCPDDKILNPITKRCVLKSGPIGKLLLKQQELLKAQKEPIVNSNSSNKSNSKDFKKSIINELIIIKNREDGLKAQAYQKVINNLLAYKQSILSYKDFELNIKAGKSINGLVKSFFDKKIFVNDLKKNIIKHFLIIKKIELKNKNFVIVKEYQKVLLQLYSCNEPIKTYDDFIANIHTDNEIINKKIKELIDTGEIKQEMPKAQKEPIVKSKSNSSNSKDFKQKIIKELFIIKNKEVGYKALAYQKIINKLYAYKQPILSYNDFELNIKAGKNINGLIKSFFDKKIFVNDLKKSIIKHLLFIKQYEAENKNVFKAKAYQKVLIQLYACNEPIKTYDDFIANIHAGERINKKIKELIDTGEIKYEEENIKKDDNYNLKQELAKVYGIGQAKIKTLIKEGITSVDDLKKNQHLLNTNQKIGLLYFDDLNKRIPLDEYLLHKSIIEKDIKKMKIIYDFVGSYRRGSNSMGDIDLLIMKNDKINLIDYINKLKSIGYVKEILSLGNSKFTGIVNVDNTKYPFRQIDILISPPKEYYFSLIYFTGSASFNIGLRNYVKKEYGYTLSEHGIKDSNVIIPKIKNEKDIFDFFKIKYVEPNKRKLFIFNDK